MSIFYDDYVPNKKLAYMNWFYDIDPNDANLDDNEKNLVKAESLVTMGKSHLANAILSLYDITSTYVNNLMISDTIIFPIFYNIWQGLENICKSGIMYINIMDNNSKFDYNHELYDLYDNFNSKLESIGIASIKNNYLKVTTDFINELKSKNARYDFGRFPFTIKGDPQFYNKSINVVEPYENYHHVPNICVDLVELFYVICEIFQTFPSTVYAFQYYIDDNYKINDKNTFSKLFHYYINNGKDIDVNYKEIKSLDELIIFIYSFL